MVNRISIIAALLTIAAVVRAEDTPVPTILLKAVRSQPEVKVTRSPVGGSGKARVPDATAKASTPVTLALVQRFYDCTWMQTRADGPSTERTQLLRHYELQGTDVFFSWSVWSTSALGHFQTVMDETGPSYLAWVDGATLCYVELSVSNDPLEQLMAFLKGDPSPAARIPVSSLVDLKLLKGGNSKNALYTPMDVVSIGKDSEGRAQVKVAGVDPAKPYTFVRQDGKWRVQR